MTKDEALNIALEYLRNLDKAEWSNSERFDTIAAILKGLAEPQPVGWCVTFEGHFIGGIMEQERHADYCKSEHDFRFGQRDKKKVEPVFFQPPKRKWVGLEKIHLDDMRVRGTVTNKWVRKAEEKLKDLNT